MSRAHRIVCELYIVALNELFLQSVGNFLGILAVRSKLSSTLSFSHDETFRNFRSRIIFAAHRDLCRISEMTSRASGPSLRAAFSLRTTMPVIPAKRDRRILSLSFSLFSLSFLSFSLGVSFLIFPAAQQLVPPLPLPSVGILRERDVLRLLRLNITCREKKAAGSLCTLSSSLQTEERLMPSVDRHELTHTFVNEDVK